MGDINTFLSEADGRIAPKKWNLNSTINMLDLINIWGTL